MHVQSACQAKSVYIIIIAFLVPYARGTEKAWWKPEASISIILAGDTSHWIGPPHVETNRETHVIKSKVL